MNGAATTPSPDGVIELLFTSGTTSRPKAVMWTNAAVLHGARTLARAARYDEADVALVPLSLSHAAAQAHQLWPTLTLGGRVVLLERFSARRFFDQARDARRDDLRALRRVAADAAAARHDGRPAALRHVTFAQSLTRAEYTDWERRIGVPLQHLWGMTETVGLPIMSPLEGDRRLEAMGRAVPGYRVEVRGEQASDGGRVEGELVVSARPGDDVTLGYFGDPDGTASLLHDGVLWTGDVVQRDADGFLHFVGRHGDIIRRAGLSFSSLEVEEVIRSVEGVVDVAVVGLPDDVRDERVAAVVVAEPGVTEEALRARCLAALAAYKRPEIIAFDEHLPRTSVGKVRKHIVVERLLDGSPRVTGATYVEPERTLPVVDDCDVLVVGGGAAGIAAAVAAAREGADTVLVSATGRSAGWPPAAW